MSNGNKVTNGFEALKEFDSNSDGKFDSNDGLLVFDKNSNGKIDDVNELFGNATQSGFSMLKQLFDVNSDNLINDKDTNFSKLKIW